MSHYTVAVIVDHADSADEAVYQAEDALIPFDEERDVEPYFAPVSNEQIEQWAKYWAEHEETETSVRPTGEDATEDAVRRWTCALVGEVVADNPEAGIYDEESGRYGYMSTYNKQSKWDWYQVGGRWGGYFKVRDDAEDVGLSDHEDWHDGYANPGLRADVIRVKYIDFEGMRKQAEEEARDRFDAFERAVTGLEPGPSFKSLRDSLDTIEEARLEFWQHEWNRVASEKMGLFGDTHEYWFAGDPDARSKFIARSRAKAIVPWAVLIDGQWLERGSMGWFGVAVDEQDIDTWTEKVNELLESLDPEAWIVLMDCHI